MRGKSSYFPFRPGGLGDVVVDDDDEAVNGEGAPGVAAEKLEKAFEKGYGASLPSPPLSHLCAHPELTLIPPQAASGPSLPALRAASILARSRMTRRAARSSRRRRRSRSSPSTGPCSSLPTRAGREQYRCVLFPSSLSARKSSRPSSPPLQNGRPAEQAPQLDSSIEELLPTRVRPVPLSPVLFRLLLLTHELLVRSDSSRRPQQHQLADDPSSPSATGRTSLTSTARSSTSTSSCRTWLARCVALSLLARSSRSPLTLVPLLPLSLARSTHSSSTRSRRRPSTTWRSASRCLSQRTRRRARRSSPSTPSRSRKST